MLILGNNSSYNADVFIILLYSLYFRALRAHFLTQQVLYTILLERIENVSHLKAELKELFQGFLENKVDVTEVLQSPSILLINRSIDDVAGQLSTQSCTSKLWIEYMRQASCVTS